MPDVNVMEIEKHGKSATKLLALHCQLAVKGGNSSQYTYCQDFSFQRKMLCAYFLRKIK